MESDIKKLNNIILPEMIYNYVNFYLYNSLSTTFTITYDSNAHLYQFIFRWYPNSLIAGHI